MPIGLYYKWKANGIHFRSFSLLLMVYILPLIGNRPFERLLGSSQFLERYHLEVRVFSHKPIR